VPRSAAQLWWQVSPPAAGVEHEQDPLQGGPVIDPWSSTRPTSHCTWRDQRLDQLPEPILDQPLLLRPRHDRRRSTIGVRRSRSDTHSFEISGSPLLARRGRSWRFAAIDVAFADLRAAGKAAGGSVNDVYLAALLGGYRHYHAALGTPVEAIPMTIPISLRKPSEARGGNQITAARFAGPVAITDPRARIEHVRTLIRDARAEPALDVTGTLAPLVARLPSPLIAPVVGPLTRGNDLQASNIPGIRDQVYLAGARIERMYTYGPLPGCAAMITMVTHGDTGCVAVNFDAAAFTQPQLFVDSLVAGFTEVLSLHPGASPALARD
jgi:diacylglycerol O-acyltransferase